MTERIAWIDCSAGASGDMFLGALVAAGVPLDTLQRAVDALGVETITLSAREVHRCGLAATKVDVSAPASNVRRAPEDVAAILRNAHLAPQVDALAREVFDRLTRAEAGVHGIAEHDVHFHELGALDTLADVVAAAAGFVELAAARVVASAVGVGSGTATSAHGQLPVPVPATLALLISARAPVYGHDVPYELCTPTGAALLAAVTDEWGPMPAMTLHALGAGAGSRDIGGRPNVLRLVLGRLAAESATPTALVLEANVDDLDPRLWPAVLARLLAGGASDAWLTPILMKKGRPAHSLSVLVTADRVDEVRRAIFSETSTIGVRESPVTKYALERDVHTVTVDGQQIRVKVARNGGATTNATPEYDDIAAAAQTLGRPIKSVLAAAIAAAVKAGLAP